MRANKIANELHVLANSFGRSIESASKSIARFVNAMRLAFVLTNAKNSTDSRKRKAYIIYRRTKSKRIKNKQLKIMEG